MISSDQSIHINHSDVYVDGAYIKIADVSVNPIAIDVQQLSHRMPDGNLVVKNGLLTTEQNMFDADILNYPNNDSLYNARQAVYDAIDHYMTIRNLVKEY